MVPFPSLTLVVPFGSAWLSGAFPLSFVRSVSLPSRWHASHPSALVSSTARPSTAIPWVRCPLPFPIPPSTHASARSLPDLPSASSLPLGSTWVLVRARETCFCASQACAVRKRVAGVSLDHDDEALPQSRSVSPPRDTDRYGRIARKDDRRIRTKQTVPEADGGTGRRAVGRRPGGSLAKCSIGAQNVGARSVRFAAKGAKGDEAIRLGTAGQRAYPLGRPNSALEMCVEDPLGSLTSSAVDTVVSGRFRTGTIHRISFRLRPSPFEE